MPVWILPGKWHLLYSRKSNKAHHKTAAKYLAISHVRKPCIRQQQQHIPISVIQHSLRIFCFLLSLVCLELYAFIPSMSIGFICFYIRTIRRFPKGHKKHGTNMVEIIYLFHILSLPAQVLSCNYRQHTTDYAENHIGYGCHKRTRAQQFSRFQ